MATNSAQGFLWVPLRIQAMCLDPKGQSVIRAMADYRNLPFQAKDVEGNDVDHEDHDNLSENILAPPFSKDLPLSAGIHLHWFLPDALTQGEHSETGTRFPYVPNRWLVLRNGGGMPERQWVVESDYLHPESSTFPSAGETPVNILMVPDPAPGPGYRYRFLGRALPLDAWRARPPALPNSKLKDLTAAGPELEIKALDWVRATFASFYPNCRTVFGFHDKEFETCTPPPGLRYDVIGWYEDPTRDRLAPLLAEASTPERLKELLEEQLEWSFEPVRARPAASLYHARLTFAPGPRSARDVIRELPKPSLTIAQTETEALAAYLAYVRAPETNEEAFKRRRLVEDQLEALQLTDRLAGHTLDLDALLMEARHERGFASLSAGIRWSVRPKTDTSADFLALFRGAPRRRAPRTPPPAWAGLLEELNRWEEEYQRALDELEHLRQRMYARWYTSTKDTSGPSYDFFKEYVVKVRRRLSSMARLVLEQDKATGALRARVEPVAFTVVSKGYSHYEDYKQALKDHEGQSFDLSDEDVYAMWPAELEDCCGVQLTPGHTIRELTSDKAWGIHNEGVVYPVRETTEGLTLEIPPSATSIAVRLVEAFDALQKAIAAYNATATGAEVPYALRALPAAPYWQAADPVLLMTGEAAAGALWSSAKDELLQCRHVDLALDLAALPGASITALKTHLAGLGADVGNTWSEQPWNPFMMHWSFSIAPCGRDDTGDYDPALILKHYTLGMQGLDLTLKEGIKVEESFSQTDNTYKGISLLTPSASLEVRERIVRYLEEEVLPDYYTAEGIPGDKQVKGYLERHFTAIKEWYFALPTRPPEDEDPVVPGSGGDAPPAAPFARPLNKDEDPVVTALWAYEELQRTPCLAQSLGNFNEVLLLREPTVQLKISDPITYKGSLKYFFTDTVRDAMSDSVQHKPLSDDRFNPLRAGAMSITGLWLVDTFGQVKPVVDLDAPRDATVITTTDQTPPNRLHHALLSPRLAQPARLRFEWLPAKPTGGARTNDHPETNPVCGFLLVNNIDAALAVYDKDGRALGSIDRGNTWRTAPESGSRVRMSARGRPQLPNAHLQRVVEHVLNQDQDETFLPAFLSTLRTALETIDPEAYAESPSRALLMARPVAVVRAALSLELMGPPAFDPTALGDTNDLVTRGLEKVKFPVRLGEFNQLNDGVVGYFREQDDESYEEGVFYSPQRRDVGHAMIRTYADGVEAMKILLEPRKFQKFEELEESEDPQHVTLLLDPRGQVHATAGVLPSPQMRLSPEHYARALEAMEVSFLTAPLLTDQGALRIAVPEEAGYAWSWVTQEPDSSWSTASELSPPNPRASFSAKQEIREGWLILRRAESTGE